MVKSYALSVLVLILTFLESDWLNPSMSFLIAIEDFFAILLRRLFPKKSFVQLIIKARASLHQHPLYPTAIGLFYIVDEPVISQNVFGDFDDDVIGLCAGVIVVTR